jgi:hypothetical protein
VLQWLLVVGFSLLIEQFLDTRKFDSLCQEEDSFSIRWLLGCAMFLFGASTASKSIASLWIFGLQTGVLAMDSGLFLFNQTTFF